MTDIVFNHHSLPFESAQRARESVPDILRVWSKVKDFGFHSIRVSPDLDPSWYRVVLAPGLTWSDWLKTLDKTNPESEKLARLFLGMASKTPLLDIQREESTPCDVHCDGKPREALRAAHCLGAPLLSHPTRSPWSDDPLRCELVEVADNDLICRNLDLINLVNLASVERNIGIMRSMRDMLTSSASDLAKNWKHLYPHVIMCGEVSEELRHWRFNDTGLAFFRRVMNALNEVCEEWRSEPSVFNGFLESLTRHGVNCSDESSSTKQRFAKERRFRLPNGAADHFWFHAKGAVLRVHFLPNEGDKTVFVGYCGTHLPTASDPK